MSADQLTNYLLIALIIIVAIGRGVSAALDFYIKKSAAMNKPVDKQVISVKEKADWLVNEASTMLDLAGAEKKEWATNQLQRSNPNLTDAEARGAIQTAYNKKEATQSTSQDSNAQPIGFVSNEDDKNEN